VRSNPVSAIERPREPRRHWRILSPVEIERVERAFFELVDEAEGEERAWREQARVVFLCVVSAGLRAGEVRGLRWHHVSLSDRPVRSCASARRSSAGSRTHPRARSRRGRSRSATGSRRSCGSTAADPGSRGKTSECSATRSPAVLDDRRYAVTLRLALARAKITDYVRPFHDGRHTSITNAARPECQGPR
jgi:integrase